MKNELVGYRENLARLERFYQSDYYQDLKTNDPQLITSIVDQLCLDCDARDPSLYQALSNKFQLPHKGYCLLEQVAGEEIRLAADIICGWKQLMQHQANSAAWLEDYRQIRGNLNLHFLWPKHRAPTINTYRYVRYRDRIDYLLVDLKAYFSGQETPMQKVYLNQTTALWLEQFNNSFVQFIEQMQLQAFVNDRYQVWDIASEQTKILTSWQGFKNETLPDYLESLLRLNRLGKFGDY
ncbi:hypothetical protein HU830_06060 [Lactobacillus sp. DCY120]|uniref:Uncharacterized protein n=1 Tax=Bombilactobacillus apium TaxID=2675299 RepID=A0A850R2Y7_9LACO|nr:hypothetical protein [Bombilactobacillus apium]NVY96720.1 hypothetical protein [Bombilactobacillus apium]